MSHKPLDTRHSIESCTLQLHTWRPFQRQPKTLDSSDSKPYHYHSTNGIHTKRPCLSDRATSFSLVDAAAIDMSKLTIIDDDRPRHYQQGSFSLIARKRRRRGSRSVSGRSSDRSGTRRCCSVGASAAYGTCSDLPVTDSSGELFVNGDPNWASDVSEARNSRRERDGGGGTGEKDGSGIGFGPIGGFDAQGNESGYGSEPGYRGDAEFGYGDELDEEEDDARLLFWGEQFGAARSNSYMPPILRGISNIIHLVENRQNDHYRFFLGGFGHCDSHQFCVFQEVAAETDSKTEMVGENTFSDQKTHYRCRRKKHDCRMVDSLR